MVRKRFAGIKESPGAAARHSSGARASAHRARGILPLDARRGKLGRFDTLDIGGGFPIEYTQPVPDIGRFCAPIRRALHALPKKLRVIAEPGRYIAGPSAIGVATVMGRAEREGQWWYYLDDGVYGSLSGRLFDHAPLSHRKPEAGRGTVRPRCSPAPPATASM